MLANRPPLSAYLHLGPLLVSSAFHRSRLTHSPELHLDAQFLCAVPSAFFAQERQPKSATGQLVQSTTKSSVTQLLLKGARLIVRIHEAWEPVWGPGLDSPLAFLRTALVRGLESVLALRLGREVPLEQARGDPRGFGGV